MQMLFAYGSNQHMRSISSLSFILALQRSNETYKSIRHPYKRLRSTTYENVRFTYLMVYILAISVLLLWSLCFLLLLSGDIQPNPGPDTITSSSSSSSLSENSLQLLSSHLSIMHLNIQSIIPKIDIIRCEAQSYSILVFSESWLKPEIKDDSILIENFQPPFRTDRLDRPGGGVVIYVRDSLSCKRRYDLEVRGLEVVWLEIKVKGKILLLGGFYRPPNSNNAYFDLIAESFDRASNTGLNEIIITGDFNFNMLTNVNKFSELINQYNFKQTVQEPTHHTENSSSLIDLFLFQNTSSILFSGVMDPFIPNQVRYHCPIIVVLKFLHPTVKTTKRKIWIYERADFDKFRELLSSYDLVNKLESDVNIDSNVNTINQAIREASEKSIPNKIVIIRPNDHPWITCTIRKLIRKRKRYYRKYKQTSNNHYWEKFKAIRNACIREIRVSKANYFDKLESQLTTVNSNSQLFWKTSKQLLNIDKRSNNIPTLCLNGEDAEDNEQKANMLNRYFSSQTHINDQNKQPPQLPLATDSVLDSILISAQDIKDVLENLDEKKACGPNHSSPRLLKAGATILSRPLSIVFNRSLRQGYFPSLWKDGYITPIHKKDDKSLPSNYRPISLLDPIGKTMERCVHKRLYNYIFSNQILTPFQSGFVHGDSTTYQLIHTYHTFCEAVDSGKEVRAVFCDISKAFDRVWHKGLLYKLSRIGCSEHILKWFCSYLSHRRQCVVLCGTTSDWEPVYAGVPQGSILGPLLFLIFINDIVMNINCSIRLFADDTSLYIVVENPQTAALTLNLDLDTISRWAFDWLVDFNERKTVSLLVSKKQNQADHPPLTMNNTVLSESKFHKHLGLTFSDTCDWTEHINRIAVTAWTRINLLRALKFRIHRNALERMYFVFIRPLLEYSDAVWDNCTNECKNQLESIHNEAARIVCGGTKLCSIRKLLEELGWETLHERRSKHKLVIFYKILNGLTPHYLSDLLPPLVGNTNPYNLRNSGNIQLFRARTNLFFNSFFPSTVRAWNNLSEDIKDANSVAAFKYRLNRNIKKPPKYYNAGSRKGQILHSRLRMECSSLNSHLYRKNIVPSPSCECGGFESPYHFFTQCSRYSAIRNTYLQNYLPNYSTHDLLFGKESVSDLENETLFLNVQEYILKSKRFG